MDQSSQPPQPVMGIVPGAAQITYPAPAYALPMVTGAPPVIGAMPSSTPLSGASLFSAPQQQLSYQHIQQYHHQQQQQQQHQLLQTFWSDQIQEIQQTTDFKNHSLPLARIKKIMKADEDVRMISAEAPVFFAKACEIFILELTLRSWINTEENKRRTLQKNDIAAAITRTDIFDFLVDVIPRDELKDDVVGIPRAALPGMGSSLDSVPYYYIPAQPQMGGPAMIMGKPDDQMSALGYAASPQAHPMPWPQPQVPSAQQQMPDGG